MQPTPFSELGRAFLRGEAAVFSRPHDFDPFTLDRAEFMAVAVAAVDNLDPIRSAVARLRLIDGRSLAETGRALRMTKGRVRHIEEKVKEALRATLARFNPNAP